MHRLRVFLALILGLAVVIGLLLRYRNDTDRQLVVDPLQPLWTKIGHVAGRLGRKQSDLKNTTTNTTTTDLGIVGEGKLTYTGVLHPEFVPGRVLPADVQKLVASQKTFGDRNADILLLQWCDFASPYCIEGYEKGVIFEYINAFPEQLKYQFKGYPRDTNPDTLLQHQAALCAESLADSETYLSFYFSIYQSRGKLTRDEFLQIADKLHIEGFASCLEKQTNIIALQKEMQTGRTLFDFSTLPANVIINIKTGQYVLIPGLYKTKEVLEAIQWLLDQGKN